MLYELFQYLNQHTHLPGMGLFEFLSFRAALAAVFSLVISILLGDMVINKLRNLQIGETVRDLGLEGQKEKQGTPTMGGTLILSSIFLSVILWGDWENRYLWVAFLTAMSFGVLGWVDDRLKIKYKSTDGLSAGNKILWQSVIALLACSYLYFSQENISEKSLILK